MTITSVYNSFRWLVAPLIGLLFGCQVLAICIVSHSTSSLDFPSESPVHLHAHGHGETKQGLSSHAGIFAESEKILVTAPAPLASVIESTNHSSPHIAEHDCCDANEDTLRTAILITLAFGIVLTLMRIPGASSCSAFGATRRNSPVSEDGYPRPHLVYCKLLN